MATILGELPFSAPATLGRQKKQLNWFGNAKEIFMRPWRLRSSRKFGRGRRNPDGRPPQGPKSLTNFEGYSNGNNLQQQQFPNFSRLSPLGGRPQSRGRKSGDDLVNGAVEATSENRGVVNIPENPGPSRPPLSNIFPMFNNGTPLSSSSSNKKALEERRHSTPGIPLSQQATPEERRASASSDTSADKPRHGRRERRASVTRELPLLPKRGDNPFQTTPPTSLALQISPYSEYSGPPAMNHPTIDYSKPNQITLNFGPARRPPVSPGGGPSNFSYPPLWPQPCEQLRELEEELEEDGEGDGEEEGVTMMDEEEDLEGFKHAELPDHMVPIPSTETAPSKGKEALGKLLRIMSSSKRKPEGGTKPAPPVGPGKGTVLEEEEEDIKGFDNFFLY